MEAWERMLVDRGFKTLDEVQKKTVRQLLAKAWKVAIQKRCVDAEPWDSEGLACQWEAQLSDAKNAPAPAADEKRYFRDPTGRNVYKPVDRDALPTVVAKEKHTEAEMDAYYDMLDRRAKAMLQHGKVAEAKIAKGNKNTMVFRGGK